MKSIQNPTARKVATVLLIAALAGTPALAVTLATNNGKGVARQLASGQDGGGGITLVDDSMTESYEGETVSGAEGDSGDDKAGSKNSDEEYDEGYGDYGYGYGDYDLDDYDFGLDDLDWGDDETTIGLITALTLTTLHGSAMTPMASIGLTVDQADSTSVTCFPRSGSTAGTKTGVPTT